MSEGINVLSLFDGMSCGQIALHRAGIKVKNYYASEIDKPAMKVAAKNFPETIHVGDVTQVKASDLEPIDLVIGGSPCQGFSFAGKMLNFEDERSKLFFEYVRLKEEVQVYNPELLFLLENVRMKYEHELVISRYLGNREPININSKLLSAQNRERLYWTNFNEIQFGLFDDIKNNIQQPTDKGLILKDVLQSEVDDKYYLSEKALSGLVRAVADGERHEPTFLSEEDIARTVDTRVGAGGHFGQYIVERSTAGSGTNLIREVKQLNQSKESGGVQPYQQNRIFDIEGISPALLTEMSSGTHAILEAGGRIRRLTPVECCRLQTVPDDYCFDQDGKQIVSDSQIYRMTGNGWTVDVIAYLISQSKLISNQ